jgi:hypothetical protein
MACHSSHYFQELRLLAPAWIALAVAVAVTSATTVLAQTPITRQKPVTLRRASRRLQTVPSTSAASARVSIHSAGSQDRHTMDQPSAFGTHFTFGVLADPKSNTLWACSNRSSSSAAISGTPLNKANVRKRLWMPLLQRAEVRYRDMYSLRWMFDSLARANGSDGIFRGIAIRQSDRRSAYSDGA